MLFTSFYFLPWLAVVLTLTVWAKSKHPELAKFVVIASSLFFYITWSPTDLAFLLISISFNFLCCALLWKNRAERTRAWLLSFAVFLNVMFVVVFKLTVAFPSLHAFGAMLPIWPQPGQLPLGISFFTFQQIAFLVQVFREKKPVQFSDYFFIVSFFPHLIAGPLLQQRDILPQVRSKRALNFDARMLQVGLMLFTIGLAKKLFLADSIAPYATEVFSMAERGQMPGFVNGWLGTMACLCQFYFDFSGYSDMAAGIACMFGIKLPMNFYSPMKAASLGDFWRRWNITLGRFLEHYLFRNIAGFRPSVLRHSLGLFVTMFVAGAWHGATLNFMLWGVVNGAVLVLQHCFRLAVKRRNRSDRYTHPIFARFLLLIFLLVSSCLFYTKSIASCLLMLQALLGLNGFGLAPSAYHQILNPFLSLYWILTGTGISNAQFIWLPFFEQCITTSILFVIIYCCPNSYQLLRQYKPMKDSTALLSRLAKTKFSYDKPRSFSFRLTTSHIVLTGFILGLCLLRMLVADQTNFNYYGF